MQRIPRQCVRQVTRPLIPLHFLTINASAATSSMAIIITVCILAIAVGVGLVWYACKRAPEGYEDRVGFRKFID